MLSVLTLSEAFELIRKEFHNIEATEAVAIESAVGRTLARSVIAGEFVPDFNRSTVDGYAVRGADTFGSSDAMPALLTVQGEVGMGEIFREKLSPLHCVEIPTGGALPEGADAVVMLEYTEDYKDGTVAVFKPAAPGTNLILRGDDVCPGKELLPAGRRLGAADIGALAALGITEIEVKKKFSIGIISTGDELIPVSEKPSEGRIRDANSAMLQALCEEYGVSAVCYGIILDREKQLGEALDRAVSERDAVILSGGSSVGIKDMASRLIGERGELLFHGLALKPGKPTLLGRISKKPVLGLPGHPAAAYFTASLFLPRLIEALTGERIEADSVEAFLAEPVSANHGREQLVGARLSEVNGRLTVFPIRSKSGLITSLAGADGYFSVARDREGLAEGERVRVVLNTSSRKGM